jgi:hypothetical protein
MPPVDVSFDAGSLAMRAMTQLDDQDHVDIT